MAINVVRVCAAGGMLRGSIMSQETKPAGDQKKQAPDQASGAPPRLGPDHRDLYLLIVGIVLGILLGPAVLGRVSNGLYQKLMVAGAAQQQALDQFDSDTVTKLKNLASTGVTPVAVDELARKRKAERKPLEQALQGAQFTQEARNAAVLLAILALMVFEAMLDPASIRGLARWRGQLATARYALMALWLALLLADPTALEHVNILFVVLLVALGLGVALAPLGWLKRAK